MGYIHIFLTHFLKFETHVAALIFIGGCHDRKETGEKRNKMSFCPSSLPPVPVSLKPIERYLQTANEFEIGDPVITYWCRSAALENGLKLDKNSREAEAVLLPVMDWLEKVPIKLNLMAKYS